MDTVDQIWQNICDGILRWHRREHVTTNAFPKIDVKALEDRTLYSITPVILDVLDVQLSEDGPNASFDLTRHFSADDGHQHTDYAIVERSGDPLFDRTTVAADGRLTLDLASDRFGNAELLIQADNRVGVSEWLPVEVQVLPVNDTPTTTGIVNIREAVGTGRTVIDLFAAFDDVEDGPRGLTYTIAENSNPALFDSVTLNQNLGRLILDYADNATGVSRLNVVATDSGGLSVGMEPPSGFAVYNEIHGRGGTSPNLTHMGIEVHDLWTGGRFFVGTSGNYQHDQIDFDRFDRFLAKADGSIPHTFNLEDELFDNSPEGRDRFAELLSYARTKRPDLELGVYRILPERQMHHPVNWHKAQLDESLGLSTWFTERRAGFKAEYDAWLERNALYRTEDVSPGFGDGSVADLVDIVNPSLYTFARNKRMLPVWRPATLNAKADTVSVDGPSFEFADTVRLNFSEDAEVNNGLRANFTYHVVNAKGSTFQLALAPGGEPIDFNFDFSGQVFAGAMDFDYAWHDPNVVFWEVYAKENIAEAHKYGKRVHAWIKPSLHSDPTKPLDYDFFRWQLEVLRPLVDGIVIWEDPFFDGAHYAKQEWWAAMEDFMATLNGPNGSFRVNVVATPTPDDPVTIGTPVADTLSAKEDTPATWDSTRLLANDLGVDGQPTIRVSQPDHGTLEYLGDGSIRYTPDADFSGVDQFRYRVTDGRSESAPATVDIRVASQNDAAVARNDRLEATEDEVLVIRLDELLQNDFDVEGDELNFRIVESPSHGKLVKANDGTLRYRPDANFSGIDRFEYRVNDGVDSSNTATVVIDVSPVNDLPNVVPSVARTKEDTPLVLSGGVLMDNDLDADMERLRVVVVDQPSHGRVVRDANGKLVYRPDRNFHGTDQFGYLLTDGHGRSDVVALMVRVLPENDDPIVVDDEFATKSGQRLRVDRASGVLANDRDVERDELRVRLLSGPSHGNVTLHEDGSFVYSPSRGFSGIDRFRYVVLDGQGGRSVGDVVLKVAPIRASNNQDRDPDTRIDRPTDRPPGLPVGMPLLQSRR